MLTFVPSRRWGSENLVYNGYRFRCNKSTHKVIYYQCCERNCSSKLTTDVSKSRVVRPPSDHNHPPMDSAIKEDQIRNQMLREIQNEPNMTALQVYEKVVDESNVTHDQSSFPKFSKVRSAIYRSRGKPMDLSMPKHQLPHLFTYPSESVEEPAEASSSSEAVATGPPSESEDQDVEMCGGDPHSAAGQEDFVTFLDKDTAIVVPKVVVQQSSDLTFKQYVLPALDFTIQSSFPTQFNSTSRSNVCSTTTIASTNQMMNGTGAAGVGAVVSTSCASAHRPVIIPRVVQAPPQSHTPTTSNFVRIQPRTSFCGEQRMDIPKVTNVVPPTVASAGSRTAEVLDFRLKSSSIIPPPPQPPNYPPFSSSSSPLSAYSLGAARSNSCSSNTNSFNVNLVAVHTNNNNQLLIPKVCDVTKSFTPSSSFLHPSGGHPTPTAVPTQGGGGCEQQSEGVKEEREGEGERSEELEVVLSEWQQRIHSCQWPADVFSLLF